MKRVGINYNRIAPIATIICLIIFCIFVFFFETQSLNQAQSSIDDHARVIAADLWSYNYQGASEYLKLAATSQNYETLIVTDHSGKIFEKIETHQSTKMDAFLSRLHLIPRIKLMAYIEHRGNIIGWIEAIWRPETIFIHLYVFCIGYGDCRHSSVHESDAG